MRKRGGWIESFYCLWFRKQCFTTSHFYLESLPTQWVFFNLLLRFQYFEDEKYSERNRWNQIKSHALLHHPFSNPLCKSKTIFSFFFDNFPQKLLQNSFYKTQTVRPKDIVTLINDCVDTNDDYCKHDEKWFFSFSLPLVSSSTIVFPASTIKLNL